MNPAEPRSVEEALDRLSRAAAGSRERFAYGTPEKYPNALAFPLPVLELEAIVALLRSELTRLQGIVECYQRFGSLLADRAIDFDAGAVLTADEAGEFDSEHVRASSSGTPPRPDRQEEGDG